MSQKLILRQTILALEGRIAEATRNKRDGWEQAVAGMQARLSEARDNFESMQDIDGEAVMLLSSAMQHQKHPVFLQSLMPQIHQQGVILPKGDLTKK
jgi:hypothetical protein